MNLQFLSDEKGRRTAVQMPIEEWEKIKSIHPDVECLSSELPNWQKQLLDIRLRSINDNPELIKAGDDLFDGL